MDDLVFRAILIFLIAAFGYLEYFFGNSNIGRPLVVSTLTGLALGNLQAGVIAGATLELVWLGAFPIGASNPPDYTSGAILGTSYIVLASADPAAAVLLAVPVSTLMAMYTNFMMMFVVPLIGGKADRYAEKGDCNGVDRMHYLAIVVQIIPQALLVALAFYFGAPAIEAIVNSIPEWLNTGLGYATGIIPAIGLALIARMILNKQLVCFLFIGFFLCAYLNVPVIGLAGIGACIVAFLFFNDNKTNAVAAKEGEVDNDF